MQRYYNPTLLLILYAHPASKVGFENQTSLHVGFFYLLCRYNTSAPWCWVQVLEIDSYYTGLISRHMPQNTICEILCHLSGLCHSSSSCWTSFQSSEKNESLWILCSLWHCGGMCTFLRVDIIFFPQISPPPGYFIYLPFGSSFSSSSSIIRLGTSFHSISSLLVSASVSSWWIYAWILSCIHSLTAISSGSSGITWISSSGFRGISRSLWSTDGSQDPYPPLPEVPLVALSTCLSPTIGLGLYPQDPGESHLPHSIASTRLSSPISLLRDRTLVWSLPSLELSTTILCMVPPRMISAFD